MNKKEVVTTPEASTYGLCYSPALKYGDVIYVSGQVGADEKGNIPATIQEQTVLAIENAKKLIDAAGSSLENVIMCQCFLQKNEDFAGMNEAYEKYFGGEHNMAPARVTVLAPPVDGRYLIEIVMIAGI